MASPIQFFGQYLLANQIVSQEQLDDAVDYQRAVNLPLGALALSKALLSERQVLQVHTLQRKTDQPFGEIAVQRGYMTRAQLDELLKEQSEARVLLGEALVQKGHLTRDQLNESLIDYHAAQGDAEQQVLAALDGLHDPLAKIASDVTGRMLLRLAGQVSKLAHAAVAPPERSDYWLTMPVEGDRPFSYVLTCSEPLLLRLATHMLRSLPEQPQPTAVDELVIDTGKEFVNIVVGHVCSQLSREGLRTMPEPVQAAETRDAGPPLGDGSWLSVTLLSTRGPFGVGLRLPG